MQLELHATLKMGPKICYNLPFWARLFHLPCQKPSKKLWQLQQQFRQQQQVIGERFLQRQKAHCFTAILGRSCCVAAAVIVAVVVVRLRMCFFVKITLKVWINKSLLYTIWPHLLFFFLSLATLIICQSVGLFPQHHFARLKSAGWWCPLA